MLKKLKLLTMKKNTLKKEIESFKMFTMHCLRTVANMPKWQRGVVKKMKRVKEDHKSTLMQIKDTKCEVENLKEELLNAYSKIKFLELEVIQANVKVERITTKKLDSFLTSQKSFLDKTGLGYTSEESSSAEPKKEMKFVLTKVVEKLKNKSPIDEEKAVWKNLRQKGSHCL
ncbi:hypothetical protein SO802_015586 [Lithocarpus litseifolius]|uniref:Uncharacterized protein n=1 Tax=Lithocarpus litseifolius TaxID=425828 RepID=A0AAW2CXE2_9ROSI